MERCKQQTSIQRPCPQDKHGAALHQGEFYLITTCNKKPKPDTSKPPAKSVFFQQN